VDIYLYYQTEKSKFAPKTNNKYTMDEWQKESEGEEVK